MKCLTCKNELAPGRYTFDGDYRGTPVQFEAEGLRCPTCGFQTVKASQSAEYARSSADAFRTKHGLLTSTELRDARSALKMSQEEFADHVGVGIATIKRAEWGHAQDKKTDEAIRRKLDPARLERAVFDSFWLMADSGVALELSSLSDAAARSVHAAFAFYDVQETALVPTELYSIPVNSWMVVAETPANLTAQCDYPGSAADNDNQTSAVCANTQLALAA